MGHATVSKDIETIFLNAWKASAYVGNTIILDNGSFVKWSAISSKWEAYDTSVQLTTPYVSLEIWEGKSVKASIGGGPQKRRTVGTVFISVNVPGQTGTVAARTIADFVKTTFRDLMTSGGIEFYEGSVSRVGEKYYSSTGTTVPATGQWWICTVAIPYRHDESL